MTDLIVIDKEGNSIHKYIADGTSAIVVIQEGVGMTVKATPKDEAIIKKILEERRAREQKGEKD